MKKFLLIWMAFSVLGGLSFAGPPYTEKEMKQAPPSQEWYADNELNVSLWGAYAFTETKYHPNLDLADLVFTRPHDRGTYDNYLGGDHAWGGGIEVKYFFRRYFGVGIQGFALDARRNSFDITSGFQSFDLFTGAVTDQGVMGEKFSDRRVVGSVLGTLTLRYPISHSRFAPYVWAGAGAIFGGGEKRENIHLEPGGFTEHTASYDITVHHFDARTEVMGQFGGGLEVRITPHIGWMNDFSWNVINGANDNFGMVRTGLNLAF